MSAVMMVLVQTVALAACPICFPFGPFSCGFRSLCYLRMGKLPWALSDAFDALSLDPNNAKAWGRLGDACRVLKQYQAAHLAFR